MPEKGQKGSRICRFHEKTLVDMLDQCGIPEELGVDNASDLFEKSRNFLHTTSIIKYPVFNKGKNYTGHRPPINRSPLLEDYACREFPIELTQIPAPALVVSLGKTAERVISRLIEENKLPDHTYLTGFPHPSGANGHRVKQFQQQRKQLREKVKTWGCNLL
ncbi:hypothetical protein [Lentibacillus sp. CBA3610]|uniref:hypothetical protein n=1 Tax=Lentibacillus sp. CBA3610 TaxID=2518176 RepID=UPI00350E3B09